MIQTKAQRMKSYRKKLIKICNNHNLLLNVKYPEKASTEALEQYVRSYCESNPDNLATIEYKHILSRGM